MLWLQKISFKTETFSLIKKGARKTTQFLMGWSNKRTRI